MSAQNGMGLAGCALLLALGVSGCGGGDEGEESGGSTVPNATRAVASLQKVAKLAEPIHLAEAPGGGLYVAERGGTIRALSEDGVPSRMALLDLSEDVYAEGEGGLFSLAFSPSFERDGLLYVAYASKRRVLAVEEFRLDPGSGELVEGSRREVLRVPHPEVVHWGGLLAFGPDRELYLGTGDGGPPYPIPATAQDPDSLLGKLLRIDPRSGSAEVMALGLRNPWRYSFDSATGDLWIGDVGDFTQEEVDFLPARRVGDGTNFGWPDLEGTEQTTSDAKAPGSEPPFLTYDRTGKDDDPLCAITGGLVVRDPELPVLEGRYIYGDFCEGRILSVDPRATGEPESEDTGLEVPRLVSFAEDASGGIYALSLEGWVYRLAAR